MVVWARGHGRPRRLWKQSTYFLREAGLGHFFNEPLVSGSHFPGVPSSVHSCLWEDVTHFLLLAAKIWTLFPRIRRIRSLLAQCPGSTVDTCWVLLDSLPTFSS